MCCRVYIACRCQCTQLLQPFEAGADPGLPGVMQTHDGLSHCCETGFEIQEMKVTDKLRVPGLDVQPEAHFLLHKDSHVEVKD